MYLKNVIADCEVKKTRNKILIAPEGGAEVPESSRGKKISKIFSPKDRNFKNVKFQFSERLFAARLEPPELAFGCPNFAKQRQFSVGVLNSFNLAGLFSYVDLKKYNMSGQQCLNKSTASSPKAERDYHSYHTFGTSVVHSNT